MSEQATTQAATTEPRPLTHLEAYLKSLPNGLDSYPDCVRKGALVRQYIEELPIARDAHLLPEPMARLVTDPPLPTAWSSEVMGHALHMASRDLYFASHEALIEHVRAANHRLLHGSFFRALFPLVPVAQMLRGAVWRWETFHRGLQLQLVSHAPGRAEVHLKFPSNLVPDPLPICYSTAITIAVEACGARNVRLPIVERTDTRVVYQGTWS